MKTGIAAAAVFALHAAFATVPADRLPGEPEWKRPVEASAFPDALSAFVFRNWGVVDASAMARTIGAEKSDVVRIAGEMGLRADEPVSPLWRTMGYATVLRRNWHLLPYGQLMELTGMSRAQMKRSLAEDDYLASKLGIPRPNCPPVMYSPGYEAAGREGRLAIRRILAEEDALPGSGGDEEPRFAFLHRFNESPRLSVAAEPRFDLRMIYPFSADYGDVFADDSLASCPEGLIKALSERGANALWLHAVLSELTTDPAYPEFGRDAARRIGNLRRIARAARKAGMKLILYVNEPRAQPAAFFDAPGREAMRGSRILRGGMEFNCMCTRAPDTLRWLRDALAQLFRAVPELGGVFTITMSENPTHCASHFERSNNCPRCSSRPCQEFIVAVNKAIYEGVRAGSRDAEVIFYDTAWPDDAAETVVPFLPKGGRLVSWSEKEMPFRQAGLDLAVNEYSISKPGPGPRAMGLWAAAKKAGLKADAKLQASTTWEICAVPYLPAMDLVAEHAANLSASGVDGVMLSWSLGGYPSPNLALFSRFGKGVDDRESVLDGVAADLYGAAAAKDVRTAWRTYSEAFRNYPMQWQTVYYSPVQMGPANLLYLEKTGWSATMVNTAYDDFNRWTAGYAKNRGAWVDLMSAVAEGFARGDTLWAKAMDRMTGAALRTALRDQAVFRAATLHFRSAADQARFVLARDSGDTAGMAAAARRELATAREMLSLSRKESVIGYESSNRYMYVPNDFREKILNCRAILSAFAEAPRPPAAQGLLPAWAARADNAARLHVDFSRDAGAERAVFDFPLKCDLSSAAGLQFDFYCADVRPFTAFSCYLKCGAGWRRARFAPETEGEWCRITLPKKAFAVEENPSGWDRVEAMRIACWRDAPMAAECAIANVSALGGNAAGPRPPPPRRPSAGCVPGGEFRAMWCHNAYGPDGAGWGGAAARMRECGFNTLFANLAWGGVACYDSKVLPVAADVAARGDAFEECRAACRTNGISFHVWKVCWNMGAKSPREFAGRMAAEGRIQHDASGAAKPRWLCPSHPANRKLEADAFAEIASKRPDGVHFDYMRYPDSAFCFCDGCRGRFEAEFGAVQSWPADVLAAGGQRAAEWRRFRVKTITSAVREAAARAREAAPGVAVSAAVFIKPRSEGIGQHWGDWLDEGIVDFVCPMDYDESTAFFRKTAEAQASSWRGRVFPGIGLSCWSASTGAADDAAAVARKIFELRRLGFAGFSVFDFDRRSNAALPVLHALALESGASER